ncbi:uncharacterized protein [Amphiura filiformis]|uniref:uncharacterized protein n=1 Tax=Amphiura filiformis TaxID=82378 RepID=UPI003B21CC45
MSTLLQYFYDSMIMANMTITGLVCKSVLYINLLFILTTICLHVRNQAIAYEQVDIGNTTSCETYYTNLSQVLNISKHSCLRIVSPPGNGIRMDLLMVDAGWSIYDYFYIQYDRSECEEQRVVAFSGMSKPCSAEFNTTALEIHISAFVTVQFIKFTLDKNLLPPICNFSDTVGLNQDHQSCAIQKFYDEIHVVTQEITTYQKLVEQHPSLAIELTDDFDASQLPPLQLPVSDITCVGQLPKCQTGCSCSLTYQQFAIHCSATPKASILLLYHMVRDPTSSTCNTTALDISSRQLQDIQTGSFSNLTDTTYLLASYNDLETLQNETFIGLDMLQVLDLSNNRLTYITKGAFLGLLHLSQLCLNGNELRSVTTDMFVGLNHLQVLILTDNSITTMKYDAFLSLKQLKIVSLRMNMITNLYFQSFSESLCILDVSDNDVHHLTVNMSQYYQNLTHLYLQHNAIANIEQITFELIPNLSVIYLSDNVIKSLPSTLSNFHRLKRLWLHSNMIYDLDVNVFYELEELTILTLHMNKLTTLPSGLFNNLANLKELYLYENSISELDQNMFQNLHKLKLTALPSGLFDNLANLKELYLYENNITELDQNIFQNLHQLILLDLHKNAINTLPNCIFQNLTNLRRLDPNGNMMSELDKNIFNGLTQLQALLLYNNFLTVIKPLFNELTNLSVLGLQQNRITTIKNTAFQNLSALTLLDLRNNSISKIEQNSFLGLGNESFIVVDTPEICCFANYQDQCIPNEPKSPYLTCKQLLTNNWLRSSMWILGIFALAFNGFVVVYGSIEIKGGNLYKNKLAQILYITNLAAADFIMGIYLIIVAMADLQFGHQFPLKAENWRNSFTCKLAGFLAVFSGEASLFILTLISIERLSAFIWPWKHHLQRLYPRSTKGRSNIIAIIVAWMIAFILSSIPIAISNGNQHFYVESEVCISLPLARYLSYEPIYHNVTLYLEPYWKTQVILYSTLRLEQSSTGPTYSTGLFLGLNFLCCVILFLCYASIFVRVIWVGHFHALKMSVSRLNIELRMTLKMGIIVLTDLLCWMPIICLGILVQMDKIKISPEVFPWIIAFVLPINSTVNPLLYGIWAISSRRREYKRRADKLVAWDETPL